MKRRCTLSEKEREARDRRIAAAIKAKALSMTAATRRFGVTRYVVAEACKQHGVEIDGKGGVWS